MHATLSLIANNVNVTAGVNASFFFAYCLRLGKLSNSTMGNI
jgi:hypothetical protein